jgi:hypothetical protein
MRLCFFDTTLNRLWIWDRQALRNMLNKQAP